MNRRKFIQASTMSTMSMMALPGLLHAGSKYKNIGIQLYTLKDVIYKDPKSVLKKVAEYGYKELETYGYKEGMLYGMPVAEYDKYTKGLGMKTVSGHYGIELIMGEWEKCVADAKAIGQKYMVMPWLAEPMRNKEKIKEVCESMNKAGEVCKKYGIKLQYHNHDFEFKEVDGQLLYDFMLNELDPALVSMEMDLYWVIFAGHDPIKYFEKYPGRFTQWHVKDRDKDVPTRNTEVGNGSINFKPIFAQAKKAGMTNFYVEQEYFSGSPLDSAKVCIDNLKKILA